MALPPPGVKFKQSTMPFVQMENISIFLRACQAPPLNLHQHDIFLTVDLFEQKDPAQVLQCLGAFSRAANALDPATFPTAIGPRSRTGAMSPQATGLASPTALRTRGASIASNASSAYGASRPALPHRTGDSASGPRSPSRGPTTSHVKSPSNGGSPSRVSTWSRRDQESVTSPAWNIAQYGYMGGASQGNLGISFGGRRQITGLGPQVPSLAEKERIRREEEERKRQEADEDERRRRAEAEAQEEQARREEERRWEEETERLRDEERRKAEEEQRLWDEQEQQWQLTEQKRHEEEQEAQARLEEERRHVRSKSDNRLRGQFLSQYQAEQDDTDDSPSGEVRELEKALELARQREAEYERERQQRLPRPIKAISEKVAPRPPPPPPVKSSSRVKTRVDSWSKNEREFLHTQWEQEQEQKAAKEAQAADPDAQPDAQPDAGSPVASPRPLPDPTAAARPKSRSSTAGSRPLPDPARYSSPTTPQSRTDRVAGTGHTPASLPSSQPQPTYSRELGGTAERDGEDRHRAQSQSEAKAAAWASKSLLEREMEMERQRQREWEEAQKATAKAVRSGDGGGIDGRWDVGQWAGYTGGDGQNRGTQGIGAGRRQIVGPRPLPGSNH